MIFLILIMGFVNLCLGAVLAMQLGFGPPGWIALADSLCPMPQANELAEMPLALPQDTSAEAETAHSETPPSEKAADLPGSDGHVSLPGTEAPYNSEAIAETSQSAAELTVAAATVGTTATATDGKESNASASVLVDDDTDLANNPFLEQSVLDEVRSLGDRLAEPLDRTGDTTVPSGK
jgi:hypothetical protein